MEMFRSCLLGRETMLLHRYGKTNSVPLHMKYILVICKYLYVKNSTEMRVPKYLFFHILLSNEYGVVKYTNILLLILDE